MPDPVSLKVHEVRQYVRNVRTRMPFRYGQATLTRVPILNLRVTVEDRAGRRAEGWSGDCLPPGWFDKRSGRTFPDDISSLRDVVAEAIGVYLGHSTATAFELWLDAYHEVRRSAMARGETGLTCGFGPALVERSVIDAVGKLSGTTAHQTIYQNLLGIDLGRLHARLAGEAPRDYLADTPLETIGVRQTIGLLDPLTAADVPRGEELGDGLPQTLEAYLDERGLRYLKVKVGADLQANLERCRVIAWLLDQRLAGRYVISLDGNELFHTPAEVATTLEAMRADPALESFYRNIQYVEQPLAREVALDPSAAAGLAELAALKPVVIDESDDGLETYPTALELGYQGTSIKNCKGVAKAVGNRCLTGWHNRQGLPQPYFLTCEDLMNTAVLPLHQDLCTASTLGVSHVERNGHHYVRGLDHLSPSEIEDCLSLHGSLYEPLRGNSGQLRICDGLLDLRSLDVPGYGVAAEPDWDFLTPLEDWRYDDLGLSE